MTATAEPLLADDGAVEALVRRWLEEPPSRAELQAVLEGIASLPWPDGHRPALASLARAVDGPALVEALDRPGPARLGAVRLVTLIR